MVQLRLQQLQLRRRLRYPIQVNGRRGPETVNPVKAFDDVDGPCRKSGVVDLDPWADDTPVQVVELDLDPIEGFVGACRVQVDRWVFGVGTETVEPFGDLLELAVDLRSVELDPWAVALVGEAPCPLLGFIQRPLKGGTIKINRCLDLACIV